MSVFSYIVIGMLYYLELWVLGEISYVWKHLKFVTWDVMENSSFYECASYERLQRNELSS